MQVARIPNIENRQWGNQSMLALRSLLFNILFYLALIVIVVFGVPAFFLGRRAIFELARFWARVNFWLLDKICSIKYDFRGVENIPDGAIIVAPKHQSIWETFALGLYFQDFTFILKRELTWIPFFGWYLKWADMIAIDRASGRGALAQVIERSKKPLSEGRQIIIFPEGTRRPVGAPPMYKYGIAHLYEAANVPCLPVALNSGLFWPRRQFLRQPGTILVEFLPPIEPGLDKDEFFAKLQNDLERATKRLIDESLLANPRLSQINNAPGK